MTPKNIVLITGASSGIGAATASLAARAGWGVCLGYRIAREKAERLASDIVRAGGWAQPLHLPLEDLQVMDASLSALQKQSIAPTALVLSGSPAPILTSFLKTTPDLMAQQWESVVVGNHHLIVEMWKRFFRTNEGGHIVAILSEAMGPPPWPHMTAYITARHGLQSLLECALAEFGVSGLRVSAVSPDYTDTPMLLSLHEHVLEAAKGKRSRFLTAEEVGQRVLNCLQTPPAEPAIAHHHLKMPAKAT